MLYATALPSGPASMTCVHELDGSLTLTWTVPADTGGGDSTTVTPIDYGLEVDEGFVDAATGKTSFTLLTNTDPANVDVYTSTTF